MKAFPFKFALLILVLIFFVFIGKAYQNKVFSLHFVDEEEYFTLAKYLQKGEVLYSETFTNRQPLIYVLSAGVQMFTEPNSIYLLLKRHREAVIVWSFLWSLLLFLRFGPRLLPVIFLYELSKIYLLGNLFLTESLAVYPLIYLLCSTINKKTSRSFLEIFWMGMLMGLIIFLLAPLWPLIVLFFLLTIFSNKENGLKCGLIILSGFTVVALFITKFISWPDYFYQTVYTNLKYFYPIATAGESPLVNLLKSFFAPVVSFRDGFYFSQTLWIIRLLSVVNILGMILLIKRRQFYLAVLIFLILGLANIRFVTPGFQYYQGFHLLPWYALLITTSLYITFELLKFSHNITRASLVILWIITFGLAINFAKDSLFKEVDMDNEFFINYSTQYSIGEAVRIMKDEDDLLFVAPDEWLVYWQADIKHAHRSLGFYAWMYNVPYINSEVHNLFKTNPPTFFYANNRDVSLKEYFSRYTEIKKDGNASSLFVLPEKITKLSDNQKDQLRFHNFSID